jgi:uncharacterized pyridoxal phosphate-containing UPF0001 family protein
MIVMASAQQITERIRELQATLPPKVTLVAVTKLLPVEVIRTAYAVGVRHFGESRVQEAIVKQTELRDYPDICKPTKPVKRWSIFNGSIPSIVYDWQNV